jgi:outer membrane protein insertion porin family
MQQNIKITAVVSNRTTPKLQTRFLAMRPTSSPAFSTLLALAAFSVTSQTAWAQPPIVSRNPTDAPVAQPADPATPGGLTIPVGPDKDKDKSAAGATTPPTTPDATPPDTTAPSPPPVVVPGNATGDAAGNADVATDLAGRTIANVRVVGNRVVPSDTVLGQATGTRVGGIVSANQLQGDLRRIDMLGFFASVQQQVTLNLEDPEKVDVTFVVVENRPVTGFVFQGNSRVTSTDLEGALTTKVGTVLNRNTINTDVEKIQGLYSDRGLASLVTESRQTEDGKVVFVIQEARIGRVDVSGLRKTKESLVRKLIRSKRGDAFDQLAIRRDLNAIYDTGLFDDITYKVGDEPATPGSVVVTISVKEKRTGQFSVGASFDNRSKLGGFLTVGENNLFGQGKRATASVELGSQRTFELGFGDSYVGKNLASYDLSLFSRLIYREPRLVSLITGTNNTSNKTFQYQEKRTGVRFNFNDPLEQSRDTSVLLGFRAEKARLYQTDINNPGTNDQLLNSSGNVTALSLGYLRDKRDLRLDSSRGGRQQIIVERAFKLLGGTAQFTKLDIDLRQFFPLIGPPRNLSKGEIPLPRLVLAGRFVFGKSLGQLPAFEQYFVGGSDTVRGYNADEQFGDNQFYSNLELRYRLNQQFQLVGFTDVGKAYGGKYSTDLVNSSVLFSVGAGLRVKTPIGPVRLDVAKGRQGVKTHFGIGSTF